MADFDISDRFVRANEGGYANNPLDRGGETYRGIARKRFPAWSGWMILDSYKAKPGFPGTLDKDPELGKLVRAFFKQNFWNEMSLDGVQNQAIATELYDTGVNMGTGMAGVFLQRVLNATNRNGRDYADLSVDGKIGPATVDVLNRHRDPKKVLKLLNCLQGTRYVEICERDHTQEIFMNSWADRVSL